MTYDVFLSHNNKDQHIVEQIGRLLKEREGLNPFLDKWYLIPGKPWQEELEQALQESRSVAIFVGPYDISPWHNEEMRVALNYRTRDTDFSVIPVLLPGANMPERGKLPAFLSRLTWVDLRGGIEDEAALARFVSGIRGEAPGDLIRESDKSIRGVPYRGLEKFKPEDAAWFFGRESETQQLVEKIKNADFMAILGASGSGKSSVALAGLIPALQKGALTGSDQWPLCIMSPKSKPLEELAINLCKHIPDIGPAALLNDLKESKEALYLNLKQTYQDTSKNQYLLLLIDQFEELFTLCEDEIERQQFIDNLMHAAKAPEIPFKVVITMRADFLAKCTPYAQLADTMASSQFIVTPLVESQMRLAIRMPARLAGLHFEEGLVERMIAEIGDEPGGLPLLQYALFQLWENRQGNRLTIEAYERFGGVSGALSKTANTIYDNLTSEEQDLVKEVMLALVQLGEGTEDTRRRVEMERFSYLANTDVLAGVVEKMIRNRLLISEEGQEGKGTELQVAHEALIQSWERLRTWIDENRENLKLERRIQIAADDWEEHGKSSTLLLRGPRLSEAVEWQKNRIADEKLITFIRKSHQQFWRLRIGISVIAIVLLVGSVTAAFIFNNLAKDNAAQAQRNASLAYANATQAQENIELYNFSATQAQENANLAEISETQAQENLAQAKEKERLMKISLANDLAVRAKDIMNNGNLDLACLLAIEAIKSTGEDKNSTFDAGNIAYSCINSGLIVTLREGNGVGIASATFSPDGNQIVTTNFDNSAIVWSVEGKGLVLLSEALQPPTGTPVFIPVTGGGGNPENMTAILSPNGNIIVSTSFDNFARVWSEEGEELAVLRGHTQSVTIADISPDGMKIVTASQDDTARVWSLEGEELAVLIGHASDINSAKFSPDGKKIVTASQDDTARVWSVEGDELAVLKGHQASVTSAAFSPDGTKILTTSYDGTVRLWSLDKTQITVIQSDSSFFNSANFSPDGNQIVTIGDDNIARLWSLNGEEIAIFDGHTGQINSIEFSRDGSKIITASNDNTVIIWSVSGKKLANLEGHTGSVNSAAFSSDGNKIVTSSSDKTVQLWTSDGNNLTTIDFGADIIPQSAAYSPDGSKIITTSSDLTTRVYSLNGEMLAILRKDSSESNSNINIPVTGSITGMAFSPDGNMIVAPSYNDLALVWTLDGSVFAELEGHSEKVIFTTFNANGDKIVTTSKDGTARIWTVDGNELAVLEGHHGSVISAAFSLDGLKIVTGSEDNTARVWTVDGEELAVLNGHTGNVTSVAFNPDSSKIVTVGKDNTARIWTINGTELDMLQGDAGNVTSIAFSPNGSKIVTIDETNTAWLWTAASDELIAFDDHSENVSSITFSPDGNKIVIARTDGTARIWASEGQKISIIRGNTNSITSTAFNPEGSKVITTDSSGIARLWTVEGDIKKLNGTLVALSPEGSYIVIVDDGNLIQVLTSDGEEIAKFRGHRRQVTSIVFSPDGNKILTTSEDKTAIIWSLRGAKISVLEGHTNWVISAAFSPAGDKIITTSYDGTARIWSLDGEEIASLDSNEYRLWLNSATFSPDGRKIVTAGEDNIARVWSVEGEELAVLLGHTWPVYHAVFSPDGNKIITASGDKTARIWTLEGKEELILRGHTAGVRSVMYSPDGLKIVTSSVDKTAIVWSLEGIPQLLLDGHSDAVNYATFRPDGKSIITSSEDHTVRIWPIYTVKEMIDLIQYKINRDLTEEECQVYLHRYCSEN